MPAKKTSAPPEIYQIKVTLLGSSPPIWRRLLVPAGLTLERLHHVLQAAMGWDDYHLHEFSTGGRRFGRPDPDELFPGESDVEDERSVPLFTVLRRVGAKIRYTYDFGDDWEHGIVLEKRLPVDPATTYPACTDGRRACPPEDCGGIGGFYDLLDAIRDPHHPRHEELRDWLGDDFDPEAFSVDNINRMITPRRRSAKALKG